MKKLLLLLTITVTLFANTPSSQAGYVYEGRGIMVNVFFAVLGGYPLNEMTEPPIADLVFVDGFSPVAGGSFTQTDVASLTVWNQARTISLGDYLPGDTIAGTFSITDITNSLPEIDLFEWDTDLGIISLNADDTLTLTPSQTGTPLVLTDTTFAAQANSIAPEYTGIQITEISTNIVDTVMVGATLHFEATTVAQGPGTVHYQFFIRAGYGQPSWGGNKWTVVQ